MRPCLHLFSSVEKGWGIGGKCPPLATEIIFSPLKDKILCQKRGQKLQIFRAYQHYRGKANQVLQFLVNFRKFKTKMRNFSKMRNFRGAVISSFFYDFYATTDIIIEYMLPPLEICPHPLRTEKFNFNCEKHFCPSLKQILATVLHLFLFTIHIIFKLATT